MKVARKRKKNPKNPEIESFLYAINPSQPRMSIRVVNFTLNANPVIIPATAINERLFLLEIHSLQALKRSKNALILIKRRAGSNFISFAC